MNSTLSRENISQIFESFNKLNVLIIGDVMIDSYMFGNVSRISPEAPVPIVSVTKKENRLGGAANVALNIQELGATPYLCALVGEENKGDLFLELLKKKKLPEIGIIRSPQRITTVKTRVIGNNYQMLRVDSEIEHEISEIETEGLFDKISYLLNTIAFQVIIFEDYDKGLISRKLIKDVIQLASDKKIPVCVDPKKKNFLAYEGASLFKPNLKELKEGLKIDFDSKNQKELFASVLQLKEKLKLKKALITLSEAGILISNESETIILPAHIRDIADVSGAGDSVISVAALCIALDLPDTLMASLSNLAGGIVCESVGVVPINKKKLFEEACTVFKC